MALADPMDRGNTPGNGPLRAGGKSVSDLPRTDQNLPSTESKAAKRQAPAVTLVRDLWGGNERVRDAGETYLPRAPKETPANYATRLQRSVFLNFFRRSIEGLVGFVYRKDPVLGDDVPPLIAEQWENIDNAGTHGDVFARELMTDAMTTGHAGILVDYPNTGGAKLTVADEKALGVRPYWVPIKKDDIVSWRVTREAGRTVLAQLVLREVSMEADGEFGEAEVTRYRVFERVRVGTTTTVRFRLLRVTPEKRVITDAFGDYPTQQEIPFAEVTTSGKKGLLESDPPLIDLAYLNIAHYQERSDYATAKHMTCVPILFTSGMDLVDPDTKKVVEVGPNSGLTTTNPDADAKYVSHDGAALAECRESLAELKAEMGALGLAMLAPQVRSAETAEAKRLDKSGTDSALAVCARAEQDAIERALDFHARYLGLEDGGSITINREYEPVLLDAATMVAYATLADTLGVPDEEIVKMLVKGGRLAEDADVDEVAALMSAARASRADQQKTADLLAAEKAIHFTRKAA